MVIPSLTVGENMFLNRTDGVARPLAALRRQARQLLLEWGFDLDVDQPAAELSVEQRQIVEIARALSRARASSSSTSRPRSSSRARSSGCSSASGG